MVKWESANDERNLPIVIHLIDNTRCSIDIKMEYKIQINKKKNCFLIKKKIFIVKYDV